MLFIVTQNPSGPSGYYDREEAFLEYKRREYIAALKEQQQQALFQRELAMEEQRHRVALATIARQEAARRQHQASVRFAQCNTENQGQRRFCHQPAPEEILARRLAREQEEQRHSRQFHEHILSQIFGVPTSETSAQPAAAETSKPTASTSADKGKGPAVKRPFNAPEPEPHWSAAPERARSLQEITSINRTFASLKNTFAFPFGPLERLPGSDLPRLAYNATNASIHAYEHALAELLTKLDGIESHGFKGVREARKQLVVRIGKELEDLEQKISERLAENASPAVVPVPIPEVQQQEVEDVVMNEEPTVTANTSTNTEAAATVGYDVEPVEQPQTVSIAVEEPTTTAVSQDMEVDPVVVEVPQSPAAADEKKETPSSESTAAPTLSANEDQPAPFEARDATAKSASAVLLEGSLSSDEESEIEDAVHVDLDEADAHDQRAAENASDHEVEFELI